MSATFFGGEVKYTKRYRLGQLLSTLTRHFLLMTATPHNGKEEDFQLFMALLDGDRFEGRFRDGVHVADVSDLMRRMVKENLLKFDGTPLFPERIAHTVPYKLSEAEARLYKAVTDYVREEFNRAEALENDKRAGTVGLLKAHPPGHHPRSGRPAHRHQLRWLARLPRLGRPRLWPRPRRPCPRRVHQRHRPYQRHRRLLGPSSPWCKVTAADELTANVASDASRPRTAGMSRCDDEIVVSRRRTTPMSTPHVARTAATRPCSPRGVPIPIR